MRTRERITTPLYIVIGGLVDLGGTLKPHRKMPAASCLLDDIANINADGQKVITRALPPKSDAPSQVNR